MVYTKKQEHCQAFAVDAGNAITKADMVQMGMIHAVAIAVIQDAFCYWKCIPKANQTWNQWIKHFNDLFNKLKELNAIMKKSMG